ncbi:hypothetical protein [Burkholderia gladioli]|uniref:DUF3726 domain-containing protein n=1 Tax=Burkholderia gladioli TaxID=28095 RepID=A0AAW3ES02_BURGA|nr:hypothetical protein [Burkholderia gladioli]KGC10408.1 hypothetical protein DM48_6744 [Burkholderia gladioli]MDN7466295.1 hypothetical protein [Burkholderia gladioli]MDN7812866.1 hypothetical protein [Burkholderia gladioli]PRE10714.1 hypothetical protein C6P72_34305 [Burkholderia gladioli]
MTNEQNPVAAPRDSTGAGDTYPGSDLQIIEKALYCIRHGELESAENWVEHLRERSMSETETPHALNARSLSGELVKVSSSQALGGSLSIKGDGRKVDIEGLPEAMVRACSSLLFTRVQLTLRPESIWIPAGRAAFESGVDLNNVRAWAEAGLVASRLEDSALLVEAASLRAYVHHLGSAQAPAEQREPGSPS